MTYRTTAVIYIITDYRVPSTYLSAPCRYQGRLDRYDDTGDTGYHVNYDDGDEEVLGDTIEGRDDVRLLPPDGDAHSPSEVKPRGRVVGNHVAL